MDTQINSININGCSVCKAGEENHTTFSPAHRPNTVFYQYDYRHEDGELFQRLPQHWNNAGKKGVNG